MTEGQRADTHKGLVTLFGLVLVKTGKFDKKWEKVLSHLNDDREAGDDDALSYLDEDTTRRAVREADEFVAAVERYVTGLLS